MHYKTLINFEGGCGTVGKGEASGNVKVSRTKYAVRLRGEAGDLRVIGKAKQQGNEQATRDER